MPVGLSWTVFGLGWGLGWLLLWRTRPLPAATGSRSAAAIVVPARNEAAALPALLGPLAAQLRPGDELVVVDDGSTDDTATVARDLDARVFGAPPLPAGWIGKPHACWHGAASTTAPLLVFLDADVRPGPALLDGLAAALAVAPEAVVSVQPWHDVERLGERISLLPNVVALMGCGGFTVLGRRLRTDVAFGPVLAVRRDRYTAAGGHAAAAVRASLTEDIALARAVGGSRLFSARRDATFRMYPGGFVDAWRGWARTFADGVTATRWWLALAVAAWVWSLAGAPFVGWTAYALAAVQVWVLGRRSGRFGPGAAAIYPVAVAALVMVVLASLGVRAAGTTVWKGRSVPTGG